MITLPAASRYAPIPPEQLREALSCLHGWCGDTHRIWRTVRPRDLWTVLEQVAGVEGELDHHTLVDLEDGTVTFTLWTHVRDAVTAADLRLAERLDPVLDAPGADS